MNQAEIDALLAMASENGITPPSRSTPLEKKLAEEASAPPNGEPEFDPAAEAERLELWWLNGGDRYYIASSRNGQRGWLEMSVAELRRMLKVDGLRTKQSDGELSTPFERLLVAAMKTRSVDYAVSIAGKSASVCEIGGARVLIRDSPRFVTPAPGPCEVIYEFLDALLGGVDGPQVKCFLGWLKVAIEALYAGERRPGQCLVIVGPSDCGKSRLQHQIVTPLLGGRPADPKSYFFGKTDFNNELIGSEHLLVEEIPSGSRYDDRQFFGERIKEVVANDSARLHKKNRDAVTVSPFWRLTISLNDSKLNVMPAITPDMRDKVILLKAKPCPDFYARFADTPDPRSAFRNAFDAALPGFVHSF